METEQTYRVGIKPARWPRGIHWYATLWCDTKTKKLTPGEQVYRKLSAKDAEALNKYDGPYTEQYGTHFREGDETVRFTSYDHLIQKGVERLRELFGENVRIEIGSQYEDSPTYYEE